MKTQIQFKQEDGDNGIALIHGPVTSLAEAKQELANKLNLPDVASSSSGQDGIDARLRSGGINPDSITFDQLSE
jgi:hypothetical protein